jgi:hypothetical protein
MSRQRVPKIGGKSEKNIMSEVIKGEQKLEVKNDKNTVKKNQLYLELHNYYFFELSKFYSKK